MQAKDYQQKALDRLDLYLEKLATARENAERVAVLARENPGLNLPIPDFPANAWEAMLNAGEVGRPEPYSPRRDGSGRPVPTVTLKVPTGGGKTFLAVHSAAKILEKFFERGSPKFVLWIVPSEAIYSQTKAKLVDREHPLRKLLDIASGGRVKILEKNTPLHRDDLAGQWCVMLLMLPSANRQSKETLRMFRDRGDVNGFLPAEDDVLAHQALKAEVPNLDIVDQSDLGGEGAGLVKSSLGNALRLIRPLVVLDEEQKGFSENAQDTIFGFNPRFVLGLSATPKDGKTSGRRANWLVNISGKELDQEEMIKMPIMLSVSAEPSWKDCLREAYHCTRALQEHADRLEANDRRYIRPILLVQVERTGSEHRTGDHIHAEDAKEHLVSLGLPKGAIAIKSSERDDLKALDVKDLESRANPVRAIITKQALQEGWDCSFAYVLCSLAAARSVSAMTQLVGRVLRQPHASKTGVEALDQCYVFTFHTNTGDVVKQVKKSLEDEGMGDLAGMVREPSATASETVARERRGPYSGKTYYLPKVLAYEGAKSARELDWETDIMALIPWHELSIAPPDGGLALAQAQTAGTLVAVHFDVVQELQTTSASEFDRVFAVRALADHVPNMWVAADWVSAFLSRLDPNVWTPRALAEHQQFLVNTMVSAARDAVEVAAKHVFEEGLASGRIAFQLVAEPWWDKWEVPRVSQWTRGEGLARDDARAFEKNLFDPLFKGELNGLELKVACFLDKQAVVSWWYKNVVRGYGLQGWRKNRVYPDFIVAQEHENGAERWLVLETKGNQLAGNLDTTYKEDLMQRLTASYASPAPSLGQLTLFEHRKEYRCDLVAEEGWEDKVRNLLATTTGTPESA